MPGIAIRAHTLCALVLYLAFPFSVHAEPESLEQAWALAYQNNPSLEAERAILRATDQQVSQELSNWRPSVDATGTYGKTWQFAPGLNPFGSNSFDATLSVKRTWMALPPTYLCQQTQHLQI
jgi:outer membrane protein TolC